MLIDEVQITLKAGDGGNGKVAFFPKPMRGPSGGNGGKGGDIYFITIKDNTVLDKFIGKKKYVAENGKNGGSNKKTGRNGKNSILEIPFGTTITDSDTNKSFEPITIGQPILMCRGGTGGRGNWEFRSPTNTTPLNAEAGAKGEKRNLLLILRLLADFGLMGPPNTGKSSLLNQLTKAHVKTANYPFTTLEPNLGAFDGKIIADIPGLIEGAYRGKGLGIKFLKHIEKVQLTLHCISVESDNVYKDYQTIRSEMEKYNPKLLEKPEIILLTKSDLVNEKELSKKINKLKQTGKEVMAVSIYNPNTLKKLKNILNNFKPALNKE